MSKSIYLTLPVPPSANRYWRVVNGRPIVSAEARAYKLAVQQLCAEKGVKPIQGDVCVSLTVFRARKSGDLDNFQKVALDALKGACYADDKQIVQIVSFRYDDKANPRVEVNVCADVAGIGRR